MPYHPDKHHRRSIRYKGYDYSQLGAYFITICTAQRVHLFGEIVDGQMQLSPFGRIAYEEWMRSATIRTEIELQENEFVIMPNHGHGIVWFVRAQGLAPPPPAPQQQRNQLYRRPKSLSSFVGGYKSAVTTRINRLRQSPGERVWQRNYWDRIIRNAEEFDRIRQYILDNPQRWQADSLHPDAPPNRFNR